MVSATIASSKKNLAKAFNFKHSFQTHMPQKKEKEKKEAIHVCKLLCNTSSFNFFF